MTAIRIQLTSEFINFLFILKTVIRPLDLFPFEPVKQLQNHNKKQMKKNIITLLHHLATLKDTDITDDDDPIARRIPEDDNPLQLEC